MNKNHNLEWMLWQISDTDSEAPPAYTLVHAIKYYIEKFGRVPNRCEAPNVWKGILDAFEGVEITHSKSVQTNSLMLTFDETLVKSASFY